MIRDETTVKPGLSPRRAGTPLRAGVLALTLLGLLAGCSSTTKVQREPWNWRRPFAKRAVIEDEVYEGSLQPIKGIDEYDAAAKIYEKGQIPEARKEFKRIAKKYKDNPIEEDCLFMMAECDFRQKKYAPAQDSYGRLLEKYPSTRHLETSTRRLFAIATTWLGAKSQQQPSDLTRVSHDDIDDKQLRRENEQQLPKFSFIPNFFDRSRPVYDTPGNALAALKSVWMHDPTGPLADDAVMMTAVYYLRKENYREADHYFGILREEYPKSEHAEKAFVLGSHVKLMSYQGAKYDGKPLDEADDLVRSTLNLYPEAPQQPKLLAELSDIKEQAAARDWAKVELYDRKGKDKAVAMYCELLIKDHPDSTYAQRAKERLAKIDPALRNGVIPTYPRAAPKKRLLPVPAPQDVTDDPGEASVGESPDESPDDGAGGEEPGMLPEDDAPSFGDPPEELPPGFTEGPEDEEPGAATVSAEEEE